MYRLKTLRGLGVLCFEVALVLMAIGVVVMIFTDNRIIGWLGIGLLMFSALFFGLDKLRHDAYLVDSDES